MHGVDLNHDKVRKPQRPALHSLFEGGTANLGILPTEAHDDKGSDSKKTSSWMSVKSTCVGRRM